MKICFKMIGNFINFNIKFFSSFLVSFNFPSILFPCTFSQTFHDPNRVSLFLILELSQNCSEGNRRICLEVFRTERISHLLNMKQFIH